ncbi:MAG: PilN domain-containing protein [Sulfuricellaceae bacterium]|nr:PilN domain-containing protein [Sulfuricellaceae bacterium]
MTRIRINLLPHRELKRAQRQRQFTMLAGLVFLLGAVIVLMVYSYIANEIDVQNQRNNYLKQEIAKLDKEIADIKTLREQIQDLLARKQVVENLQSSRSLEVHLLDQLVRRLPEGVYLSSIKQTGNQIALTGYAQSNARVSTLMRSLEASPWLQAPNLVEIKAATVNNLQVSQFSMTVSLTTPPASTDAQPKGAKK